MAKARLSLVLPDYAALFANELNRTLLPEPLQRLLKKARFQADKRGYYQHLLALLGEQSPAGDLPIARLRGGSEHSLCADPCYLHPDRDQLLLFYRDLDLSLDEAKAIRQRVQPLLDDFGASLKVQSPQQWLLELESLPEVRFTPKEGLNGLPVTGFLPRGKEAQSWIRLWNEIQMLLFDCPENQAREKAGKVPINSLWFWGKGALPTWQYWPHISGEDNMLTNLAAESGSVYQSGVTAFDDVKAKQALHVMAFDTGQGWEQQLNELTQNWLLPASLALKKWRLSELEIIVPEWGVYRLTSFSSWRFWL